MVLLAGPVDDRSLWHHRDDAAYARPLSLVWIDIDIDCHSFLYPRWHQLTHLATPERNEPEMPQAEQPDDQQTSGLTETTERKTTPGEFGQGKIIGPYRLLELIGAGGMGEVWLAEQTEPVQRTVALKLIKAGMNPREVVARFESERQALDMMDHPAIAKVFDAGSTPQGQPYFAMEYVGGQPITLYADRHRLTVRQRLELFVWDFEWLAVYWQSHSEQLAGSGTKGCAWEYGPVSPSEA